MKVKVKHTTEVEKELELPCFFKTDTGSAHAVFEDRTIRVWRDCVSFTDYASPTFLDTEIEIITVEEFTRIFDERIEQLQSLKSHFFTNK